MTDEEIFKRGIEPDMAGRPLGLSRHIFVFDGYRSRCVALSVLSRSGFEWGTIILIIVYSLRKGGPSEIVGALLSR